LLAVILLSPAVLLYSAGVAAVYFADLYRALLLALLYLLLGIALTPRILYLGIWLLLLCSVIGGFYAGFAPFALGLLGGFSLLVCGVFLRKELI
jgi:hypothetical protein